MLRVSNEAILNDKSIVSHEVLLPQETLEQPQHPITTVSSFFVTKALEEELKGKNKMIQTQLWSHENLEFGCNVEDVLDVAIYNMMVAKNFVEELGFQNLHVHCKLAEVEVHITEIEVKEDNLKELTHQNSNLQKLAMDLMQHYIEWKKHGIFVVVRA